MSVVVQDIAPYVQYVAAGGQTDFAFPYVVFATTDITVYKRAAGSVANDRQNLLTLVTNYTVTINNPPAVGGTVTLNVGATVGDIVTIVRAMPDNRLNNYLDGGLWSATQFNTDFDRTVLMAQQNQMYNITITPHYNVNDVINTNFNAQSSGVDIYLPILPPLCVWRKNQANTAIEAVINSGGGGAPVVLPTSPNHVATFVDTVGTIHDSGFLFPVADGAPNTVLGRVGPFQLGFVPIANDTIAVNQPGHNLVVGNVVRLNGANYVTAQADNAVDAEVIGIVTVVTDLNNFTLQIGGQVTLGLAGLVSGDVQFLSPTVAGALTNVRPIVPGQVVKPVLIAQSATTGVWINQLGVVI